MVGYRVYCCIYNSPPLALNLGQLNPVQISKILVYVYKILLINTDVIFIEETREITQ
jgi:hypothetical protein